MTTGTRRGWGYVPSLYFAEGLPYVIVNTVSVVMYKKLGVSNEVIGLTSLFYLPWVIKMFWGPLVDIVSTKRSWIIATQAALALVLAMLALGIRSPSFLVLSAVLFFVVAFASATHDIAVDGYYMLALSKPAQAFFTGIRSTFYRVAMLFGSGFLVVIAGREEVATGDIAGSWGKALAIAAAIFAGLALYHWKTLPRPERGEAAGQAPGAAPRLSLESFARAFRTYFQQPGIGVLVLFILTYRLGEAFLTKMTSPFLLDGREAGGLALSTETVGDVDGTVGVTSLVVGGILGGWAISRFGLKRTILPMALALKAPDLVYVYMAAALPSLDVIYPLVAMEQFGYGLGFTAFMVVLMYSATGPYKTSHFAISTGIMALGMLVPGMLSGFVQSHFGYLEFFLVVIGLTVPGLLVIFLLPLDRLEAQGMAVVAEPRFRDVR